MKPPQLVASNVAYPASLPTEAVIDTIRIIRNGTAVSERAQLAANIWNVQGYAHLQIFGNPQPIINGQPPAPHTPPSLDEQLEFARRLEELQKLLGSKSTLLTAADNAIAEGAFVPGGANTILLSMLLYLFKQLIAQLLSSAATSQPPAEPSGSDAG